jgi:dephospho-CoA kinase
MKIIGVGGFVRSGKDTLAELLMDHGFYGFSLGDYVRNVCFDRHKDKPDPISVKNMTETSNWLRETYGPDVVLKAALDEYEEANSDSKYIGVVLYSVRAPIEVDFILEHGGQVVWVEASVEVRYSRDQQNRRDGEAEVSLEEFKRQEELQWKPQKQAGVSDESQMNLLYVKEKATVHIENNDNTLEEFQKAALEELKDYLK